MGENQFWDLVGVLEGSVDEPAVERLTAALRTTGRRGPAAFQERLAAVLHDLDREVLCRQPVRWVDDPPGVTVPLSADAFLYLRAHVVASGRAVVARAIADPASLLEREWEDGEALLYAAETVTGQEIETRLSYETGSNEDHWSFVDDEDVAMPVVAVNVWDLLETTEGYLGESDVLTTMPTYAWWLSTDVLAPAGEAVEGAVLEQGGLPDSLGVVQIQLEVCFGDRWQLSPEIAARVEDEETYVGTVSRARVELAQVEFRSWDEDRQRRTLTSVLATCVLAVLPDEHGSRPMLHELQRSAED
ncbi:DUF4240 domain-containing protein [Pseudokineococcus basanitobsidens]|uniref:DUF4240 domain-containing protein n=2 Tax=Pseudokineococcus basanitobsidens TaxID=1926649 RepID=A0ABU8RMW9_9ACTN